MITYSTKSMNGKYKYILSLLLLGFSAGLSAQNSQVLYFMNLPQNHLMNPALRPSSSVYIGLPVISGINLNINNNYVNFSDVFMKGQPKDSIITFLHPAYNIDDFLKKIKDRNFIEPNVSVQLFGLGFSVGKDGYVFLDVNERIEGNVVIPGDLLKLALKGNESFVGSKIDLSSLRADMRYFREAGLGYSRNFTDKLRIGVKGKLLFGIADFSTVNKSLGITVNEDYSHLLDADMSVNMSGPVRVYMDSKHNLDSLVFDDKRFDTSAGIRDFFTGKKNFGLGIDIGATYDVTERFTVSASVTDLGFIKWKKDVTQLTAKNQFLFSGLNVNDVIKGDRTIDEVGQDMLDSLKNAFTLSKTGNPYTTYLPAGVSVAASYNLTKSLSVGLLSYTRFISKQVREALTVSANMNIGSAFSASLSYTAENYRYDNLGAGIGFRAGFMQFYLLSDRIPVSWNRIIDNKTNIVIPATWNTFNLRFGMNFVFGNKSKEKSDKPMVMFN